MSADPDFHALASALEEADEQIEALQGGKKDIYARVRAEHGKKTADALKVVMKFRRMDAEKRAVAEEVDAEALRILSILERTRAPRATRTREIIEEFDAETGEITSPGDWAGDTANVASACESATIAPAHGNETSGESAAIISAAPATPAAPDGEPGIPSLDVGGAKSEGAPNALVGQSAQAGNFDAQSGQAVTNSAPAAKVGCLSPATCKVRSLSALCWACNDVRMRQRVAA